MFPAANGDEASARGARCMTSSASGSASNTIEQAGSISSSRRTMCTGINITGQCSNEGTRVKAMIGMCTAKTKRVALVMLS